MQVYPILFESNESQNTVPFCRYSSESSILQYNLQHNCYYQEPSCIEERVDWVEIRVDAQSSSTELVIQNFLERQDYLGMTLDFGEEGHAKVTMTPKIM